MSMESLLALVMVFAIRKVFVRYVGLDLTTVKKQKLLNNTYRHSVRRITLVKVVRSRVLHRRLAKSFAGRIVLQCVGGSTHSSRSISC
jgi:hypothetical protein